MQETPPEISLPGEEFFVRPVLEVARDLPGMMLCRRLPSGTVFRSMITEVEAYDGLEDRASHASRGLTPRTAVMFGPPAVWYVYLCYGIHWLLNVVTGPVGKPAAVLFRGLAEVSGPGRLAKTLSIGGELNDTPCEPETGLWIEQGPGLPPGSRLLETPRIGVDYAGPVWAAKPWRFLAVLPDGSGDGIIRAANAADAHRAGGRAGAERSRRRGGRCSQQGESPP